MNTLYTGHVAPWNMYSDFRLSTPPLNGYVNALEFRMQPICAKKFAAEALVVTFSRHPILTFPSGNQKQLPCRFSSFQIPMGLLRVPQWIEMLDAQL